jgi:hypothetical protein
LLVKTCRKSEPVTPGVPVTNGVPGMGDTKQGPVKDDMLVQGGA